MSADRQAIKSNKMEELTNEEIVIAGLDGRGRGGNRSRTGRRIGRNEIGASRFRKQFLERAHKLPKDVQSSLVSGGSQISDAPWYSTAAIQGTRSELIKTSVSEEIGITNIDNGKLGKGEHLTLSGLILLYDANSIKGKFTDPFPADLLNGEWELEFKGKKAMRKMPIRKFFDGFYGYNTTKPFGLYVLNNPKSVEPQTSIEFNVDLPQQVKGFLKIFLLGTTVYSN